MEFLIFWIVTVIGSYAISFKMIFMMIKDLADDGYKLNVNKNKNLKGEANENDAPNNSFNPLIYLIPIVNMLYSFMFVME